MMRKSINKIKNPLLILAAMLFLGCEEKGVCVVTGNKLGSMGDPVSFKHEGEKYWVCCAPCIKKFKKNPDKYK
tara:strand:- start:117 stop:335 length:219 start_codon:yes stop_codon:yes gene_type:complete